MKTLYCITLSLLSLASVASFALAAPEKIPTARLTAKTGAKGTSRADSFKTDYGSYDKDIISESRIDAEINTTGREKYTAVLHWFLIGKSLQIGPKKELLRSGQMLVAVSPGATTKLQIHSGAVAATDTNLVMIGERTVSGSKIDGWALRMTTPTGAEITSVGNTPEALVWIKTQPEWAAAANPDIAGLLKLDAENPGKAGVGPDEIAKLKNPGNGPAEGAGARKDGTGRLLK